MGVFGDTLRQARAHRGVTLKEAEQATRINRHHLAALEAENFLNLPALIYQRGIVRNYATYLDLDPGKLLAMFEEARGGEAPVELVAAIRPLEMPTHWAPNFAIIGFMVVMSAVIFAWVYSISFTTPPVASTAVAVIPTVTPLPENRLALPSPTPRPAPTATPLVADAADADTSVAAFAPASTSTPAPSPSPSPTPSPSATAENEVEVAQAVVEEPEPPIQPAVEGPTDTLRVIASDGIQLTVQVDGVVQYSGWLNAGEVTAWFTGNQFFVSTSNGALTVFENADSGQTFNMGSEPYPIDYALSATG